MLRNLFISGERKMTKTEFAIKRSDMGQEKTHGYFIERRKYPRFKPDSKMYIMHGNFGSVTDISITGLAYIYCSWEGDFMKTLPEKATICGAEEHYLDDIPLVVVGDDAMLSSNQISPKIKKRRICFSDLTENQLTELEFFLLAHADVPEVRGEEKKKYRQPAPVTPLSPIF